MSDWLERPQSANTRQARHRLAQNTAGTAAACAQQARVRQLAVTAATRLFHMAGSSDLLPFHNILEHPYQSARMKFDHRSATVRRAHLLQIA